MPPCVSGHVMEGNSKWKKMKIDHMYYTHGSVAVVTGENYGTFKSTYFKKNKKTFYFLRETFIARLQCKYITGRFIS